jgi:molybdenum cofactor cytidylyltransferase
MLIHTDVRPSRIAAVVLAAGSSRRMGAAKLLLPLAGKAIISHVVDAVASADGVSPIVVVTGANEALMKDALRDRDVSFVHNADFADGEMLSSIKAGVAALPRCDAFFIVLGDQPGISPRTIELLAQAWGTSHGRIIVPSFRGKRGHPICLPSDGIDEILALPRDATLKDYVNRHVDALMSIEVDDPAVVVDVDTPQEYRRLIETGSVSCHERAVSAV